MVNTEKGFPLVFKVNADEWSPLEYYNGEIDLWEQVKNDDKFKKCLKELMEEIKQGGNTQVLGLIINVGPKGTLM